jgi:hypothetical protein
MDHNYTRIGSFSLKVYSRATNFARVSEHLLKRAGIIVYPDGEVRRVPSLNTMLEF